MSQSRYIDDDNLDKIRNMLSERLSCFVVLGYDFKNGRVSMWHAENPRDYDAIAERMRDELNASQMAPEVHIREISE